MRRYTALILIYFALLAFGYARTIPVFEASDEAEHFIYIHTLLNTGELPVIQSKAEMATQADPILRWNNQAHHAPLYYMLGALTISWTERADITDYLTPNELIFLGNVTENNANKWLHPYGETASDTHIAVYVLRALNVLIGCGTLLLVFKTAQLILNNNTFALLAMFITASLPTFVVVHTGVTNDALVIFLYTAGIHWAVRFLQQHDTSGRNIAIISLILAGIALTKLTGLSLFAVVYAAILLAQIPRRDMVRIIGGTLILTILLAGWWYLRNWQLYGDPLAMVATGSIWGRETPFTLALFGEDVLRIAKTFWMMVGYLHQPVLAPAIFYGYAALITLAGFVGLVVSKPKNRAFWLLVFACAVVTGLLLWGTRSVDISYGRLLLPAIGAFSPLLVLGWKNLLRSPLIVTLIAVPLIIMAIYAPLVTIPRAYPTIIAVENIPDDATFIDWHADDLEIAAVAMHQQQITPEDTLTLDLYFRGGNVDNPALLVTAIDSYRAQRLGHIEIFPGMAAINQLDPDTLYRVPLRVPLSLPDDIAQPRIVGINIEWVNQEDQAKVDFDSGKSLLELIGPTLHDTRYTAPTLATPIDAQFADSIVLQSATIPTSAHAGDTLLLDFVWLPLNIIDDEWTLTVQVLDSDEELAAQSDGSPYWYPTDAWLPNIAHFDRRELALPADLETGDYTLRLGWYRATDDGFERMTITRGIAANRLLILPNRLRID